MKLLLTSCALFFLAGCCDDDFCKQAEELKQKEYCTPKLVASAPDGTDLYKISYRCDLVGSEDVYFSKSGTQTQHTVHFGKTSRTVIDKVPNSGE